MPMIPSVTSPPAGQTPLGFSSAVDTEGQGEAFLAALAALTRAAAADREIATDSEDGEATNAGLDGDSENPLTGRDTAVLQLSASAAPAQIPHAFFEFRPHLEMKFGASSKEVIQAGADPTIASNDPGSSQNTESLVAGLGVDGGITSVLRPIASGDTSSQTADTADGEAASEWAVALRRRAQAEGGPLVSPNKPGLSDQVGGRLAVPSDKGEQTFGTGSDPANVNTLPRALVDPASAEGSALVPAAPANGAVQNFAARPAGLGAGDPRLLSSGSAIAIVNGVSFVAGPQATPSRIEGPGQLAAKRNVAATSVPSGGTFSTVNDNSSVRDVSLADLPSAAQRADRWVGQEAGIAVVRPTRNASANDVLSHDFDAASGQNMVLSVGEGTAGQMLARPENDLRLAPPFTTQNGQPSVGGQDMARHVAGQIAAHVEHSAAGRTEISLSPEELGKVRLVLHARDEGLTLQVIAERPETAELMRRHIDTLAQEFRNLGYKSLSFDFSDNRQGTGAGADQSGQGNDDGTSSSQQGESPPSRLAVDLSRQTFPQRAATAGLDLRL